MRSCKLLNGLKKRLTSPCFVHFIFTREKHNESFNYLKDVFRIGYSLFSCSVLYGGEKKLPLDHNWTEHARGPALHPHAASLGLRCQQMEATHNFNVDASKSQNLVPVKR